ncbi:hypothetical protein M407DRAFT_28708 [Tulasnella calospora MUT 4182]|uniref:Arrestin-like N-terminal domain-containing protein n=1 Tax=Tulasnella calospora MUT 4182 TaxID=1051891 RepID=A0A0C3Q0X7_9AGAM|nr:hypothetical protein M407DRAFT_28708 [Tulasnella calospora MUT 4182]
MSISPIRPSYTGVTDPDSDLEVLYATLPLGMPLPPAYSPSESSTTSTSPMVDETPEYSCQLQPDEVFLDGTPLTVSRPRPGESSSSGASSSASRRPMQFNTCHNNLRLSLSSRSHQTQTPAYGHNELIEGFAEVLGSLKHIERIDLIVEGMVTTTVIDRGYPISSDSKCILSHRQTLYYSASATVSPEQERGTVASKGRLFPFSYHIPTTIDGSTAPLPPSFYRMYATMEGSVRYVMRIELHKRGILRRNEKVETVFLYLPKTTPPSTRPPSWYHYTSAAGSSSNPNRDVKIPIEPASDRSQKEWKTMVLASGTQVPDLGVEFSLLKPLVYQARSPIPFSLTVSSTSPVLPDLILSCAQVTLLRCTTIHASGQTYRHEEVIGTADFGKPESPTEAQSQSKVVRVSNGCIEGGKEQGEIAWSVDGMVEVNYALQVDIKPTLALNAAIPNFHHKEAIELTTHSAEDADNWDGVLDGPALGIIGRL